MNKMGYGLLNRLDGEELKEVIIGSIKKLNNEKENNASFDTILTNINYTYFVTMSDLDRALKEMRESEEIELVKPRLGVFSNDLYELNSKNKLN